MIAAQHYMVPIDRQVNAAARLVEDNMYFCINRGRQYGKTTTLAFLKEHLEKQGFVVFSISFEGLPDSVYGSIISRQKNALLLSINKVKQFIEALV